MTLAELGAKLAKISEMGFIPTHRSGNTGIGKTLEDLLDIEENNIPLPDIGEIAELKAYRRDVNSKLTFFTIEPQPAGGNRDRFLLDNFGYSKRENGRLKELHVTLYSQKYNAQGLKLKVEKDKLRIVSNRKKMMDIFWSAEDLKEKFEKKIPALVYVLADRKITNKKEYFHYNEAYFLEGFDFDHFRNMVRKDHIVVDLRMYYRPNGSVRNHGTGYRVKIRQLYNCFDKKVQLI